MNADLTTAQTLIQSATQALKNGDVRAARRDAEQAAVLAPQLEQPWLLLAYLSSPKAAPYFLERALQANPSSRRALAAQEWLKQHSTVKNPPVPVAPAPATLEPTAPISIAAPDSPLHAPPTPTSLEATAPISLTAPVSTLPPAPTSASLEVTAPISLAAPISTPPAAPTQASLEITAPISLAERTTTPTPVSPQAAPAQQPKPRSFLQRLPRIWVLLVGLAIVVGLAAAFGGPSPLADKLNPSPAVMTGTVQLTALAALSSPTGTSAPTGTATTPPTETPTASPLPTGTASPTATALPSATNTASPSPTSTATTAPTAKPTARPQPTSTPVKTTTYTVRSGDTLNLIALRFNVSLQDLINANDLANPSMLQVGQVLIIPKGGQIIAPSPTPGSNKGTTPGKGKEIQIDISEQHIYAYQEGRLVFSFVASTGIGNSTRIGTFKVLDKIPKAYSNSFNIWMPYWMGIYYSGTLENGIHGLPLLWNGVELWGHLLGKPATYGCIESRTSEIKQIYDWAEIGTPVIIRP